MWLVAAIELPCAQLCASVVVFLILFCTRLWVGVPRCLSGIACLSDSVCLRLRLRLLVYVWADPHKLAPQTTTHTLKNKPNLQVIIPETDIHTAFIRCLQNSAPEQPGPPPGTG